MKERGGMRGLRSVWEGRASSYTWALPALIFLLVALGSLGPGSYFLHLDTPNEDLRAADLTSACWATGGSKPGIAFILTLAFALGGISPVWEMVIVTLLGALTLAVLYRLMARLSGSPRWALLGALWFLSLPTILYYTRIHMGYPLALFTLGVMLYSERRFGWAGLAFGLTITTHVGFLLPVAAWVGWSVALGERPGRARDFVKLIGGVLVFPALVEGVYFFFNGMVLGWSRAILADVLRMSEEFKGGTWPDVWRIVSFANGWPNALLLLSGLAYPAVRKPRVRSMDAVFLAGWTVVGFYTVNTALTQGAIRHRMLAGAYPLLAIATVFTLRRLTERLAGRLSRPARRVARLAAVGVVALALPFALVNHTLDALAGSRTAYAVIDDAMAEAGEAGLAVRYYGNLHAGRFFARRNQVETVYNETAVDIIGGDTRAVLIFEDRQDPVRAALGNEEDISGRYTISTYPHFVRYQPRIIEHPTPGPRIAELRGFSYARAKDVDVTVSEIWWPREPSGTFAARHIVDKETQTFILHYPGSGCVSPKRFDGDKRNYYDLLFEKAGLVWKAVVRGDLAQARSLIESALGDGQLGVWQWKSEDD